MDEISVREVPLENFTTLFDIQHSTSIEGAFQPISPDVAICDDCLRELFDPSDLPKRASEVKPPTPSIVQQSRSDSSRRYAYKVHLRGLSNEGRLYKG